MKNKIILQLILAPLATLLFLGFCPENNKTLEAQLRKSEIISRHFTLSDINGLARMIAYTDSMVLVKCNDSGIDKAYHCFLDSLYACSYHEGKLNSFAGEKIYPFLLSLDSTTFHKIWRVRTTFNKVRLNDSILYNPTNLMHISFKYPGAFAPYTKDLATVHKNYQEFCESIEIIGDLSPTTWISYLKENKRFNYNNIEERLWISLNLLRNTETTAVEKFRKE